MFRNRRSSQKPNDELIATFRHSFPEVRTGNVTATAAVVASQDVADGAQAQAQGPDARSRDGDGDGDGDATPRLHEPFRFTPSLLDVNSLAFTAMANQPPGYYTPTPGGVNTLYHPRAGDLHTPGLSLGMGLGTPLSMPASADSLHISSMLDMSTAFGHSISHAFPNFDPFDHASDYQQHAASHRHGEHAPPASYAPSSFVRQDTGYETMEHDGSPFSDEGQSRMGSLNSAMREAPRLLHATSSQSVTLPSTSAVAPAENLRFHVVLGAPTAMMRNTREIPITYLNKGQAYSITIVDRQAQVPLPSGTRFRTFIRVSFEDKEQRQRPGTCWQLWKEGRGMNEAHLRGGRLQAVEYIEPNQGISHDEESPQVELASASFDGFAVVWTPSGSGRAECTLAVRFNFLSTDFSHSKGVKGIPVRLCAKTERLAGASPRSAPPCSELAYCTVKLFRDHGAERKFANDVAHVKKTIDKLKQQIAQAESGLKDPGKRKRSSAAAKNPPSDRPGKVHKHKRTWSMSSASSGSGSKPAAEDELSHKLRTMQDMFTSTRPASVFSLRGEAGDDPDLHPVSMPGESTELSDSAMWQPSKSTLHELDTVSASPDMSQASPPSTFPSAVSATNQSAPWASDFGRGTTVQASPTTASAADSTVRRIASMSRKGTWLGATGVDPSYVPLPERLPRPAVCFYIQHRDTTRPAGPSYHRAVYLPQRTLSAFYGAIAVKFDLDPTMKMARALHVLDGSSGGLEVELDDDVVRELKEGQDSIMEVSEVEVATASPSMIKSEAHTTTDDPPATATTTPSPSPPTTKAYELRFFF